MSRPATVISTFMEQLEKGVHRKTAQNYHRAYREFAQWKGSDDVPGTLERLLSMPAQSVRVALTAFREFLATRLQPSTVNSRLSAFNRLLKQSYESGLVEWKMTIPPLDPFAEKEETEHARKSLELCLQELSQPVARHDLDMVKKRDRVIVLLLHRLLLERQELVLLNVGDWQPETGTLCVGDKSIEVDRELRSALDAWSCYRAEASDKDPFLTSDPARQKNRRLDVRTVTSVLGKLREQYNNQSFTVSGLKHLHSAFPAPKRPKRPARRPGKVRP